MDMPIYYDFLINKRISFDVDGVKANTAPLAVRIYNEKFNDKKRTSDLTEYNSVFRWINKIIADELKSQHIAETILNY